MQQIDPLYYEGKGSYHRLTLAPVDFMRFVVETMRSYGISQYELAGLMGAQQPHVWRWIHGHRKPQLETRMRIDYALMKLVALRLKQEQEEC
jgi:predicted transcriptional regulator